MENPLAAHGAAASFAWGLFKSLVPMPSPSGFVVMGASVVSRAQGPADAARTLLLQVVLPGAAGVALGAMPYYWWARRSGIEAVERAGPWLGLAPSRVRDLRLRAERRRGALVWGLFALPLSPSLLAAVAAGLLEVDAALYAVLAFAGACVRCAFLSAVGWAFRARFGDPVRLVSPWEIAAAFGAAAAVVLFVVLRRRAAARRA